MEKTSVFNLIILDESGSMGPTCRATIDGCNETINMIKSAQESHAYTQKHFLSIYAFQSNSNRPSHYICKNAKAEDVKLLNEADYQPWGGTPMLDAIGMTITDLKAVAATHEDAVGVVTIITDGYENASSEYSWKMVRDLISEVKELGWQVNFIGANIDVDKVADDLNIQARMNYRSDEIGIRMMHKEYRNAMMAHMDNCDTDVQYSKAERIERRKKRAANFFKHPDKS